VGQVLVTLELAEAPGLEVESAPESADGELLEELAEPSPDAGTADPSFVFGISASCCSSDGSPIPTIASQPKPAAQATAPIATVGASRNRRIYHDPLTSSPAALVPALGVTCTPSLGAITHNAIPLATSMPPMPKTVVEMLPSV
jgi:hypothetical protein